MRYADADANADADGKFSASGKKKRFVIHINISIRIRMAHPAAVSPWRSAPLPSPRFFFSCPHQRRQIATPPQHANGIRWDRVISCGCAAPPDLDSGRHCQQGLCLEWGFLVR
jgi:hypothetical protein